MSELGTSLTDAKWPASGDVTTERTDRWRGVSAAAFIAGALALLARTPGLLLVSGVAVAVVLYARSIPAPPATVAVDRRIADPDAAPGEETTVTLRVENTGDRLLPDIRVVDGVPDGVQIVDGSPQHGTALRPGAGTSFSYTVRVPTGEYEFDPTYVAVRDVAGVAERRTRVTASTDESIAGALPDGSGLTVPLRTQPSRLVGPHSNPETGEGVAFETVREYRRGDPANHVDWSHLATTGELRTVRFQADRTATVVLVVDATPAAAVRPSERAPTAIERSVQAAATVFDPLTADGHRVGLAGLAAQPCWIAPARGADHRLRVRERLAADPGFRAGGESLSLSPTAWLGSRLPDEAQVVAFSPLCDDAILDCLFELEARGWPVTVVSPDVSGDETAGQQLVTLERRARLRGLRSRGLPVVELPHERDPKRALARAGWA